ncbi:MAG: NAD(P)/FAD-dependent oxidoreductase, partial [Thermoplasmata archaeon]|nr:NAD(P)/FAD-dependent oxidoreductase [Thermoplasmata archaeon]
YDIVVIGGGHAGLQAGLKTALLHHTGAVIDRGPKFGRSYYAPRMDNIPGFPEGISGHKLLDRQIEAIRKVADRVDYVTPARATAVRRVDAGYRVDFGWLGQERSTAARAVVMAMGVVDRMPSIAGKIEPIFPWANFAIVDFCILCDGHELPGKTVAVLGHDEFAARTALDLLHFAPKSVEILTHGEPFLADVAPATRVELDRLLEEAKIPHFEGAIAGYDGIREKVFDVKFEDGTTRRYDRGFSGLGWYDMHGQIPRSLGCAFDVEGYVQVDNDGRALNDAGAPIPGLYCVGDLKSGWNQIPEAWASAERAVIHAYAEYL